MFVKEYKLCFQLLLSTFQIKIKILENESPTFKNLNGIK